MKAPMDPMTRGNQVEAETQRLNSQLESCVKEGTAQLEAARQELQVFSYSISHDFRAPLRHILGYVEIVQSEAGDALDETSRQHLQTIAQAAAQMGQMIDALLEYSQMGRAEMCCQRVSLAMLVEEARRELHPEIAGREIDWQIGDLPDVYGDPRMLRQALVHLLSNAVKFTSARSQARIEIEAKNVGHETIVSVRDNGVGLDVPRAGKLFGLFQRFHWAGEFAGAGVGLAKFRRIIHQHGGRAWAEGTVEGGATFYFAIPKPLEETA